MKVYLIYNKERVAYVSQGLRVTKGFKGWGTLGTAKAALSYHAPSYYGKEYYKQYYTDKVGKAKKKEKDDFYDNYEIREFDLDLVAKLGNGFKIIEYRGPEYKQKD